MQSKLEIIGSEERKNETSKINENLGAHYHKDEEYSNTHPNALGTDDDDKGKGTGTGGHGDFLPHQTKHSNEIDYTNFDTTQGGNSRERKLRQDALSRSLYNKDHAYGPNLIDTGENFVDGQYVNKS